MVKSYPVVNSCMVCNKCGMKSSLLKQMVDKKTKEVYCTNCKQHYLIKWKWFKKQFVFKTINKAYPTPIIQTQTPVTQEYVDDEIDEAIITIIIIAFFIWMTVTG